VLFHLALEESVVVEEEDGAVTGIDVFLSLDLAS